MTFIDTILIHIGATGCGVLLKMKSFFDGIIASFKRDSVSIIVDKKAVKQCIFVFYQKGVRQDTIRVLSTLKEQGVYIILVSNQKLTPAQEEILSQYVDVIITRHNYGRDFGAYKRGTQFVLSQDISTLERLIYLNDSVFYSSKGLDKFISDLLDPSYEVIGATENFQQRKHIGSFCVSVSGNIARNKKFQKYWRTYKNTDVRPMVIQKGEFGFSKVLFSLAPDYLIKVLYDNTSISDAWQKGIINIDNLDGFCRKTLYYNQATYVYFDIKKVVLGFIKKKLISIKSSAFDSNKSYRMVGQDDSRPITVASTLRGSLENILAYVPEIDRANIEESFKHYVYQVLLDMSVQGSQIHMNTLIFYPLGLPIIKNDLYFRGVISLEDIEYMRRLLPLEEQGDFLAIQLSRPDGGAFMNKMSFEFMCYAHGYI
jgi:hypothetical protein